MKWIEATVNTKPDEIESLVTQLEELGIQGVTIEDEKDLNEFLETNRQYWDYIDESLTQQYKNKSRIKFYLVDDEDGRQSLEKIRISLDREIETTIIDDTSWTDTWKEYFQPIRIGKQIEILPEWLDPEDSDRVIVRINPGLAFGTGNHETTRLALELMSETEMKGKRVLDAGCGSGILGITALKLGAAAVAGCDVDPNAATATRENAELNQIEEEKFSLYTGNIIQNRKMRTKLGNKYDIVLANIVADVILPLSDIVHEFLKPEGLFLCSGIIDNRAEEVEQKLRENGFIIRKQRREAEWNAYLCQIS